MLYTDDETRIRSIIHPRTHTVKTDVSHFYRYVSHKKKLVLEATTISIIERQILICENNTEEIKVLPRRVQHPPTVTRNNLRFPCGCSRLPYRCAESRRVSIQTEEAIFFSTFNFRLLLKNKKVKRGV